MAFERATSDGPSKRSKKDSSTTDYDKVMAGEKRVAERDARIKQRLDSEQKLRVAALQALFIPPEQAQQLAKQTRAMEEQSLAVGNKFINPIIMKVDTVAVGEVIKDVDGTYNTVQQISKGPNTEDLAVLVDENGNTQAVTDDEIKTFMRIAQMTEKN